jgi:hypothetical protein
MISPMFRMVRYGDGRDLLAPGGSAARGRILSRWDTGLIETCRWDTGPIAGGPHGAATPIKFPIYGTATELRNSPDRLRKSKFSADWYPLAPHGRANVSVATFPLSYRHCHEIRARSNFQTVLT